MLASGRFFVRAVHSFTFESCELSKIVHKTSLYLPVCLREIVHKLVASSRYGIRTSSGEVSHSEITSMNKELTRTHLN